MPPPPAVVKPVPPIPPHMACVRWYETCWMDRWKRHSSERAPGGLNHESATCVQRFDDSLIPAIHTTYRISLRSSSSREPRYPLLGVVILYTFVSFLRNYKSISLSVSMCVYTQTDRQRDIYNCSGVVWWLCCFNSMCIYHHHHYYIMMMIWEYFNSVSHTHGRVHIYAHTHTRHSSVLPATTITTTTTTTSVCCCCCCSSSSGRCARSGLYVYVCVYISCARTRYTTHTHTHIQTLLIDY